MQAIIDVVHTINIGDAGGFNMHRGQRWRSKIKVNKTWKQWLQMLIMKDVITKY